MGLVNRDDDDDDDGVLMGEATRAAGVVQKQRWVAQRHRSRRVSDTNLGLVVDAGL